MGYSIAGIWIIFIGAVFVAIELVYKFEGEKSHGVIPTFGSGTVVETGVFKAWMRRRNRLMWFGLLLIFVGSALQTVGLLVGKCR